jgi:hypothetical protein
MRDGDDVKRRVGLHKHDGVGESLNEDPTDALFVRNARHRQRVLSTRWKRAEDAFDHIDELGSETGTFALVPPSGARKLAHRVVVDEDGFRHR